MVLHGLIKAKQNLRGFGFFCSFFLKEDKNSLLFWTENGASTVPGTKLRLKIRCISTLCPHHPSVWRVFTGSMPCDVTEESFANAAWLIGKWLLH